MTPQRRAQRAITAWSALALVVVSCRFQDGAAGASVACATAQDCPTDSACEPLIQRCVTLRTSAFGNTVVAPARLGRGSRLTVSFELSSPPLEPPQLVLVTATSSSPLVGGLREGTYVYQRTVDALDGEGQGLVLANLRVSPSEALTAVRLGEVFIDATGPRVVASRAELLPDADHLMRQLGLLSRVTALSEHSTWVVTLTVDEALRAPPRLELWGEGAAAPSASATVPTLSEGLTFTFALKAQATGLQGVHRLRAHLEDVLGNPADVAVPDLAIDVDTVAPAPPAVDTAGAVVFRREPWGSQASPGTPRFTLRAMPGALEPDAVAQFFVDTLAVGRARGDGSGGFEETALPLTEDRSDLAVRAVDAAGNASPVVAVRDLEWVATPAALPGLTAPVRMVRRTDASACRLLTTDEPSPGAESPGGARAESVTGWRVAPPRGQTGPSWPATGSGTARLYFDSAGQALVLVRQVGQAQYYRYERGPTGWRFGGSFWAPNQTELSFLGHDPESNSTLGLFSSLPGTYAYGSGLSASRTRRRGPDRSAFEEASNSCGSATWSGFDEPLDSQSVGHPGVASAMDVRRGVLVMFGGERGLFGRGWENKTFESGGGVSAREVEEVSAQGTRPGPRSRAAMGYDRNAGRMLLFGGATEDGGVLGDTWAYSAKGGWTEVTPPGASPTPRSEAALAWDGNRERLVLAGGRAGARFTTDTWTWDGARWVPLGAGLARADLSLAWDDSRAELLLAGGYDSADGGTQVPRRPSGVLVLQPNGDFAPEAFADAGSQPAEPGINLYSNYNRLAVTQCFDPNEARGFTYVSELSGTDCPEYGDCTDYTLKRNELFTRSPGTPLLQTPGPGSRNRAGLGVPPGAGLMLVGGETASGLTAEAWQARPDGGWAAAPGLPTPLAAPLLSPDPTRGLLVLHGGETDAGAQRDTWEFDGQRWVRASSSGPSLRGGESLSYLPSERTVVLAQGERLLALRNGAWQTAATLPLSGGGNRSLGYDLSVGAELLLADAPDGGRPLLFERRDAGWDQVALLDPFRSVQTGGSLGDNAGRGGVVLMNGLGAQQRLEAVGLRPEVIATVDLSRLQRGPDDTVTSVRALAVTGGSASGRSGAQLTPWFETGFFPPRAAPSTQTSAAPEALQELLWRTSDPSLALRVSSRSSMSFRVQALGASDREPARVAVDYFELTLGLRRPAAQ